MVIYSEGEVERGNVRNVRARANLLNILLIVLYSSAICAQSILFIYNTIIYNYIFKMRIRIS